MRGQILLIIFICLLGLTLRLWKIDVGLPDLYQADEVTVVTRSLQTAQNNLDPGWVGYPTLWFYLLDVVYGAYFIIGKLTGVFSNLDSFALQFIKDPTFFYLLPRVLNVILGISIIIITYFTAKMFFSENIGLLAAALLAIDGGMVEHSRYATLDIPATLSVCVATYAILSVYRDPTNRNYILSGLIIGLGMSIKYFPVISCGSLLLCHLFLLQEGRTEWRRLYYAVLTTFLSFLGGTPFFFKNSNTLFTYVQGQQMQASYIEMLERNFDVLSNSLGMPVLAAFLCAGYVAVYRFGRRSVIILSIIFSFFFSFCLFSKSYYERWHLLYFPALYLIVSMGCYELYAITKKKHRTVGRIFIAGVLGILIYHPLQRNGDFLHASSLPDTRLVAREWIEDNIADGTGIFLDSGRYLSNFSVPLKGYNADLGENILLESAKLEGMVSNVRETETVAYYEELIRKTGYKPLYRLVRSRLAYPLIIDGKLNSEWLNRNKITHAVLSSYYHGRFFDGTGTVNIEDNYHGKIEAFYDRLFRSGRPIASFKPGRTMKGPYITVLELQ